MRLLTAPTFEHRKQIQLFVLQKMNLWLIGVKSVRLKWKSTSTKYKKGIALSHIL